MDLLQEVAIECPSCGEPAALEVETSIPEQSYFEDCPVCCRPMEVFVRCRPGEVLSLSITADD
jgi:cysteine-rich CPXCG protein